MNNVEELELLRKKIIRKEIIISLIIISIVVLIMMNTSAFQFVVITIFLGIIITTAINSKDTKRFIEIYKKIVILDSLEKVFKNITYLPNEEMDYYKIANTNMMYMGDYYHSNDYIKGEYKNINFELADVEIEDEYTDSDGDTHRITIFQGQWFIFDFNKSFKSDIQVCEKTFGNAKRKNKKYESKFKKVELESLEFNKKFNVYAKEEIEAYYILTPNMMERILNVNEKIKGDLLFCFIYNKLHIGLYNNRDLFEPNIHKKINLERDTLKTMEELNIITNFIDLMNLDNDLFRREV